MKKICFLICLLLLPFCVFSEQTSPAKKTALELKKESFQKDDIHGSIDFLKSNVENTQSSADKRAVLFLLGRLQEQSALYSDASLSYAKAAGITAGDAEGMEKVSAEELVLDAVRTSLNCGECDNARSYLNSAVRSSKNEKIIAFVNLYSVWCSLCEAKSIEETKDSIELLKAYSSMKNMKSVKPQVLLTLWYLTSEKSYSDQLKKEFAESPECAIVTGNVEIACVPFYLFVPRAAFDDSEVIPETHVKTEALTKNNTASKSASGKKRQVGFFKGEANAASLVETLKKKGFNAYSFTEKRESGATYYIVAVDEDADGTMGLKLLDAGYESYILE